MSLLDLSLVTRTVLTLLEERLPQYPDWPTAAPINVQPAPPDAVTTGAHALSFYLYHVREDAHTKAQDWSGDDARPLRFKPMGVSLYYLMCPKSNAAQPRDRALADQLVMGLALKTLHDFAMIDDTTTVDTSGGPKLLMSPGMRGKHNRMRILLLPKPPEDAANFWQGGNLPTRLAAYYEVAATLFDPDEISRARGRVFSLGVHPLVRGRPHVEGTRNHVTFTIPGEIEPRDVTLSPAEVPYGSGFEVFGSDLKGDQTALQLNHPDFANPVPVDAAWNVKTTGEVLSATARPAAGAQPVVPGIYGLFVVTTMRARLPDGSSRDFDAFSNQATLAIAPRIVSITFAGAIGTLTVDSFNPDTLALSDVMLFTGSDRLTRTTTNPPPAGTFFTPVATQTILFRLPATIPANSLVPIRLVVRGAESGPRWEIAP